ncbi:MAG: hypothetical protein ABSC48_16020 [Terracidiphilus sp.]|jgi:hypothetical protein
MTGDPIWMKSLLTIHVTAGFGAFLLAPVALITAKGGKQHKRWGMVYLWCMGVVAATALPMALFRPVLFLALVAILSFYLAFTGYRVLKLRSLAGPGAQPVDWIVTGACFFSSVALLLLTVLRPALVQHMGIVAILFGALGIRASGMHLLSFMRKPTDKRLWLYKHFQHFIASYIAAWTAFSTVTLPQFFWHTMWLWIWPAAIGVPAILLTTAYYKRKVTPREQAVSTVAG